MFHRHSESLLSLAAGARHRRLPSVFERHLGLTSKGIRVNRFDTALTSCLLLTLPLDDRLNFPFFRSSVLFGTATALRLRLVCCGGFADHDDIVQQQKRKSED